MIICPVTAEEEEIVIIINSLSIIAGQIFLKIHFGKIYRHQKSLKEDFIYKLTHENIARFQILEFFFLRGGGVWFN